MSLLSASQTPSPILDGSHFLRPGWNGRVADLICHVVRFCHRSDSVMIALNDGDMELDGYGVGSGVGTDVGE